MDKYKRNTMLNEKDTIMDMLIFEKNLIKVYGSALTESESKNFRTVIKNNMLEVAHDQLVLFDIMKSAGYYIPDDAKEEDIITLKENFKKQIK